MSAPRKLFVLLLSALGFLATTALGEEKRDEVSSSTLFAQILLDRAMFSPGAIDGRVGTNFETAVKAFQQSQKLKITGEMDERTSRSLMALPGSTDRYIVEYTVKRADVDRNFIKSVPKKMADQAKLDALAYTGVAELLSERFHATSELLEYLNPGANWNAGSKVLVPNVHRTWVMTKVERKKAEKLSDEVDVKKKVLELDDRPLSSGLVRKTTGTVTVVVTKDDTSLTVIDKNGQIVFHAPVSAGSEHDPLPIGHWKVNGVEHNPTFHYNPNLFWDAEASDEKAKIPPGPNNPVGVAWVDVSKPHYGLHGTPNPEKIGYTQSHGCVRLTNWDVLRLADLVKPETKVLFLERPEDMKQELGKTNRKEEKQKKD